MDKKFLWIGTVVLIIVAFLAWLFWASTRPLPGTKIADLGQGHVKEGTSVEYNSNPPTSGPHCCEPSTGSDWYKAGVYSEPLEDYKLVHSLEHGYVIMHYKCTTSVIPSASEESLDSFQNKSGDSSPSAQNDNNVNSQEDCDKRKAELEEVYNKKGKRKLIVVARPNLDTNFALTAWNYLDKFDQFDGKRIEKFIDAHLDNGPERTME